VGEHWAPLVYQYGLGLIVVLIGLYAGWRARLWGRGRRAWLLVILGGWLAMFALQGAFQAASAPAPADRPPEGERRP